METTEKKKLTVPRAIVIAGALAFLAIILKWNPQVDQKNTFDKVINREVQIIDAGLILPSHVEVEILNKLIENGVIDPNGLNQVTELNLLWALGLSNKNPVLDYGPISEKQFGGPMNMASVGGWTVTMGPVMNHYSSHNFMELSDEQQKMVEKIAQGIYRPCCDNSTHFPDCNHGMAMLGLLQYLAQSGASEDEIWERVMMANVTWFPEHYQLIAEYLKQNGINIKDVDPKILLSAEYSSGSGFAKISSQIKGPVKRGAGSDCSVGERVETKKSIGGGGCGI